MGRIILTGGPSTGKSSIIQELQKLGHVIVPEPARTLITHYKQHTPDLLPARSKESKKKFQTAIKKQAMNDYTNCDDGFFDRSIIDEIGYRNTRSIKISEELHKFAKENRYDFIFFFPFWKEIYKKDEIRKENIKEAELISKNIFKAYIDYGYDPVIVPKTNIRNRIDYILNNIKHLKA